MNLLVIAVYISLLVISMGLLIPALISTTLLPFWLIIISVAVYVVALIIIFLKFIGYRIRVIFYKIKSFLK